MVEVNRQAWLMIDAQRQPLQLVGNAWDINRIKTACDNALKVIELNNLDPMMKHTVFVHPPADDEP